jgi:phosphoribosyl 1,2-cyclic phosphate phosphodiesterase
MDLRFLGTGAAEGIPAMYCRCQTCATVRANGGKNLRTRAAFRIGEHYQIDLGPDTNWQMHRLGLDMFAVEHLLVTHTHDDHFQIGEIVAKIMSAQIGGNGKPLHIYMSAPAQCWLERLLAVLYQHKDLTRPDFARLFQIHGLDDFQSYQIGELRVEPVKAGHSVRGGQECGLNYRIALPDGRRMLYALDTGWFPDATWDFLAHAPLDIVILDCTFGVRTDRGARPDNHLDIASFVSMIEEMMARQMLHADTQIFASHINPHHGALHDELQRRFDERNARVTVAYDGLCVPE